MVPRPIVDRARLVSRVTSSAVVTLGALVLAGWAFRSEALKLAWLGELTMKANTAAALILAGVATGWLSRGVHVRWARAAACFVGAIGLVTLFEYATHVRFGIDEFLFHDAGARVAGTPGRPAPNTAVALTLVAAALAAPRWRIRGRYPAVWASIAAASIGAVAVVGYIARVSSFYTVGSFTPMALPTAVALLAIGTATLLAVPDRGVVGLMVDTGPAGAAARRLFPMALAVPPAIGALQAWGQHLGLYDTAVGVLTIVLATMMTLSLLAWLFVRQVAESADRQQALFRGLIESAPDATVVVDDAGVIVAINEATCSLLGYSRDELVGRSVDELVPEHARSAHGHLRRGFMAGPAARAMNAGGDLQVRHKSGDLLAVDISLSPQHLLGRLLVTASMRDVSLLRRLQREHARAAAVLTATSDAVVSIDETGHITSWNPAAEGLFGTACDDVLGRSLDEVVAGTLATGLAAHARASAVEGDTSRDVDLSFMGPDSRSVEASLSVSALVDDSGHSAGAALVLRDMTARRAAERAAFDAELRFRRVFEEGPVGMAILGPDGSIVETNSTMATMCGPVGELVGGRFVDLFNAEDAGAAAELTRQVLMRRIVHGRLEARLRPWGDSTETVWVACTIAALNPTETSATTTAIAIIEDISERKSFEGRLRYLADHDAVTGLFNRRRLEEELEREFANSQRFAVPGALLVLDIDHFKNVNDSLGHASGDELIMLFSAALRASTRATDIVGRLGGDEFAIILTHCGLDDASRFANHLIEHLSNTVVLHERGMSIHVTASIGVAPFGGAANTSAELLVEADIAMYEAKAAGRNCARVYSPEGEREQHAHTRLSWFERIRDAIDNDKLVLHAQPIVSLTGDLRPHYELLVRMVGEEGELVPPAAFLYIAERFGQIERLDCWVIRRAIRLLAQLQRAGRDTCMEVNISGRSVGGAAILETIFDELHATGADGSGLCIEITETAAIQHVDQAKPFAAKLAQAGCRFALDDFGAGFASFYYLKHLQFDYLKIDGEFIRDLPNDLTNQLVVQAVVGIAKGMGKRTVAEHVTDDATLELLRSLGVDYAQGYHLGEPRPHAELLEREHGRQEGLARDVRGMTRGSTGGA